MNVDSLAGRRILLGVTGSIAASAVPQHVLGLRLGLGAEVRVLMTAAAARFVTPTALAAAAGHPVYTDEHAHGLVVPHVELAAWAEVLLVMPATANTIGQVAHGLAPDLLTTTVLAATCPVVMAPSTNEAMWSAPAVRRNAATLIDDGVHLVEPVTGLSVAAGSLGAGALAPLPDVLAVVSTALDGVARRPLATGLGAGHGR